MESLLQTKFQPEKLVIINESAAHAGHRHGGGQDSHFAIEMVSSLFVGKSLVQRHRMVYDALTHFLKNGVHALKINAKSSQEGSH